MERAVITYAVVLLMGMAVNGCEGIRGPARTGEIKLSSELFGTDTYYLFGYSYEYGEYQRYPYQGEPLPDIINEGFLALKDGEVVHLPGFNTPGQGNGFALAGEHESLESAREFYNGLLSVDRDLQFETVSDTVELFQVWLQRTVLGNYVKLLVKGIENFKSESGRMYNVVNMEYTYQPNGSNTFLD